MSWGISGKTQWVLGEVVAAWPRGGASSTSVGPVASSGPSGATGDTEVESPGSGIDLERQKARPRDEVRQRPPGHSWANGGIVTVPQTTQRALQALAREVS